MLTEIEKELVVVLVKVKGVHGRNMLMTHFRATEVLGRTWNRWQVMGKASSMRLYNVLVATSIKKLLRDVDEN